MNIPTRSATVAERSAFYERLSPQALAPLWEVMKGLVPREPNSKAAPHMWRYQEARKLLIEAGSLLTAQEAERRVLVLENPALPGQSRITSSLYSGLQLILPGETAPAHRHTASALRFVLESNGGHTTVAGERTAMARGDFIVTPSGAFHDHGHDGDGPVIWLDGLDVAIVNFFDAAFSDDLEEEASQALTRPSGDALARFGNGLLPIGAQSPFGATSPVFSYPYARSREALLAVASADRPDAHFGHRLRFANPLDGGWVMPTMATWLTHLPRGFETRNVRSTDGQVVVVAEGEVTIEAGSTTMVLGENDVACVPSWVPRRLSAAKDTVLFSFSDRSAQEKLGIWRQDLMENL